MMKKKKKKELPSDGVFGNVDILTLILLRFPINQLLPLKRVCKLWFSVISDAGFRRNHLLRHRNRRPSSLLFSGNYFLPPHFNTVSLTPYSSSPTIIPSFDYITSTTSPYTMILRSCNGLLLCCSANFKSPYPDGYNYDRRVIPRGWTMTRHRGSPVVGRTYFVCNPIIKQVISIPIPDWKFHLGFAETIEFPLYLAFNPLKSPDFKIVSLRRSLYDYNEFRINIYSSLTGDWSDKDVVCFYPPSGMGIYNGVFCKGAIHWYSKDKHTLYFDVDTQCLKQMPMPPKVRYNIFNQPGPHIGYFGESRDHLLMVVHDMPFAGFDVLEMHDDYSGWSPKYHVDYFHMRTWFPELVTDDSFYTILCVIEEEEEEDSVIVLLVDWMMISYNFRHQTVEEMHDLKPYGLCAESRSINVETFGDVDTNHCGFFQYKESFASCV